MQQKRRFDACFVYHESFYKASEINNKKKTSQICLKRVIASPHEAFLLLQN